MPSPITSSLFAACCLFTAVSATPAIIINTTPIAPAPTTAPTDCVNANGIHMLTVRGLGEGYPNGNMEPLISQIQAAIPDSDFTAVPYSASNFLPPYMESVDQGATATINYIETYAQSCPNSKIVLIAYSQGAQAAMSALCGESSVGYVPQAPLDPIYASNLSSIIIYGDPSFVGNQPYNYGTATTQDGEFPRLDVAPCQVYANKMRNYCNSGDLFCDYTGINTNETVHHDYFEVDDVNAIAFIKSKM